MAVNSTMPPPSSGGLTYAIVGLGLAAATIAMFFLMDCGEKTPVMPVVDAGKPVERSTALADDDFAISTLDEVDAGAPEPVEEPQPEKVRKARRQVSCSGTLEASAIQAVVARNRAQVRSCYERALKSNNLLQGRLNVRLTVGTGGRVSNVGIGGSLRDPAVSQCVRALASRWSFPSPTGGCVMVEVPFSLTPRN